MATGPEHGLKWIVWQSKFRRLNTVGLSGLKDFVNLLQTFPALPRAAVAQLCEVLLNCGTVARAVSHFPIRKFVELSCFALFSNNRDKLLTSLYM